MSLLARSLLVLCAFGLIVAACAGETERAAPDAVDVRIGDLRIDAEIARTPDERAVGLSGRDAMPRDAGMLFLLGVERVPAFTMAGMRYPLDFVWISSDLQVAALTENVPDPEQSGNARSGIQPPVPVLYVLELNAGIVAEEGVRIGDEVRFDPELSDAGER